MAPPTPCLHTSFCSCYSLVTCGPYTFSKGGPQQVTVTQRFPDRKKLWRVPPAASEPRFTQTQVLKLQRGRAEQAEDINVALFTQIQMKTAQPSENVGPARNRSIRAWTQDKDLDDRLKAQAAKVHP